MVDKGEIIHGSLDKKWVISHKIGSGKCCDVYLADLRSCEEEKVAVKLYKEGEQYDWACEREKEILEHVFREHGPLPHLVKTLDYGIRKGRQFLVQEPLEFTLHQLVLKCPDKRFSLWVIQILTSHILRGLNHLHKSGYVHGDLKPANLMWSPQHGCLKLIDFGLSFHQGSQNVERVQSPGYQAPEVVTWNCGAPYRSQLTAKSDMWSVGCVLLWMFTGQKLPVLPSSGEMCKNCKVPDSKEKCQYNVAAMEIIHKQSQGHNGGKEDIINLISRCLQCPTFQRISSTEALHQPFLSQRLEPCFTDLLILRTCVLRLVNILDGEDLQSEEVIKDLQEDILSECGKFGLIEECMIPTEGPGTEKVYVRYSRACDAEKAFEKLNGRTFNDRTVITTFFSYEHFQEADYY